jgi:hypothetical protein
MARKDKLLDILAMAQLPEDVKIAQLAHRWIGKAFTRAHAKAIIKCYFNANGRSPKLVQALMDEKNRQEKLRNSRAAFATAAEERAKPPMLRFKGAGGQKARKERVMEIAQRTFGKHVRDNFNANTLALMSLISGEARSYAVRWIDAGFSPVRCALITVVIHGLNQRQERRYLLYKAGGRVLVANAPLVTRDLQAAWSSQVSDDLARSVGPMIESGHRIENDLEDQLFRVFDPDGDEGMRIPWTGQTVDA